MQLVEALQILKNIIILLLLDSPQHKLTSLDIYNIGYTVGLYIIYYFYMPALHYLNTTQFSQNSSTTRLEVIK